MTNYAEFFLNSKSTVIELETIEISHENFSKVFRVVRNNADGIYAKIENGSTVLFDYYPLEIKKNESTDDLDFGFSVTFGDLGEILPFEIDSVRENDGFMTKPVFIYRTYRSDDLENIMFGPITLEVKSLSFNKTGATIEVKAPSLNISRTGETYTTDRFPMLKGTL